MRKFCKIIFPCDLFRCAEASRSVFGVVVCVGTPSGIWGDGGMRKMMHKAQYSWSFWDTLLLDFFLFHVSQMKDIDTISPISPSVGHFGMQRV